MSAADCVHVNDTDSVEDQYRSAAAASVADCCQQCVSDAKCTHSVMAAGTCYLKNMQQNDGHNTMSPVHSPGDTMCLKRYATPAPALGIAPAPFAAKPSLIRSSGTMLLRLRLTSGDTAAVLEDNWYWLPPKLDQFEMGGCFTGCKIDEFAHMRDLAAMPASPPLSLALGEPRVTAEGFVQRNVTLTVGAAAGGRWLAFFVRLRAVDVQMRDVLPATWSDNFVSCKADETVTVVLEHESGMAVAKVLAEPFNLPSPRSNS